MKLGPHIIRSTAPALDWARRAPIVKALDVSALKAAQPGAITVYRCYFDQAGQDALSVDHTVDKIVRSLGGFRPMFVELLNETHQRVEWGLARYAAFTAQCTRRLHSHGLRVAGYSFSTGQPEMSDWQFLAGYDPPFGGVDAIAIHEYWNGRTGVFSTWNALRYRRVHALLGGNHPPFIITECGADVVEGGPAGWRLCGISGEQYIAQLLAYNAELEKDDYVIGATPFTCGPTADWAAFDLDGDCSRIAGGAPPKISFGGTGMAWDRHRVYDEWQKLFGGQGYNPADAFGKIIRENPDKEFGVFVGGYRYEDPFIYAYTTVGIFVYDKRSGKAVFATSEEELPLA